LLAHGQAHDILKSHSSRIQVGIANSLLRIEPADSDQEFAASAMDQITNRIWLDPIVHGTLPPWARQYLENNGTHFSTTDLQAIHRRPDFLGVNYYNRLLAKKTDIAEKTFLLEHPDYPGVLKTDIGWEVYPDGLRYTLEMLRDQYDNIPAYITENGACYNDVPGPDGQIHDSRRIDYLKKHLESLAQSLTEGCDVRGYFAWSLLDNFEWAHGYSKRFGLVYVDFARDQTRILKDSALWFRDWISHTRHT